MVFPTWIVGNLYYGHIKSYYRVDDHPCHRKTMGVWNPAHMSRSYGYMYDITNKSSFFAHQIFSEIWPGPSKGCQIAPKGCQITTPSGWIETPWQAAGRSNLHSLDQLFPFKGSIVSAEFDGPAVMKSHSSRRLMLFPELQFSDLAFLQVGQRFSLACLQKYEIPKKNK